MQVSTSCIMLCGILAAGCGTTTRPQPGPDVASRVALLTAVLEQGEPSGRPGMPSRYEAALELGDIGTKWALPPSALMALASAASDNTVRGFAYVDTMDVGSGQLISRVRDGPRIAFMKWRLGEAGSEADKLALLWRELADPENGDDVRVFCIDRMIEVRADVAQPYLLGAAAVNADQPGSWYVAGTATLALGKMFPATRDTLLMLTGSRTGSVARIAREALETRGLDDPRVDKTDVQSLLIAIHQPDWTLRRSAVAALGHLKAPQVLEPLVLTLQDQDWLVRHAAARALGEVGDRDAVGPLGLALLDWCDLVRLAALEALGKLADPVPLEVLGRAAHDGSVLVRYEAVKRLSGSNHPEAVGLLINALEDPGAGVRGCAAQALARHPEPKVVSALIGLLEKQAVGYQATRVDAIEALGEIKNPAALAALVRALKNAHPYVRERAAKALGDIGDEGAAGPLAEVARTDPDETVRKTAEDVLRRLAGTHRS